MANTNFIIQQTIKQLIIECHDDYVGLWSVIAALKNNGITAKASEMYHIAINVVSALLKEKDIVAVNLSKKDDYFHVWNLSPNEAIARIESEWSVLGREPTLGDIVWFTSKDLIVYQRKRADSEKAKLNP